jgi:hypothetical protein
MVEATNNVAVATDSGSVRRVRGPLEWDKAMVAGLAQDQGVCVRPLARRLVDRLSGEASTVVLPCGSTMESRCPTCAKRARVLRMHQCAEGWHRTDELSDELPDLAPMIDGVDIDETDELEHNGEEGLDEDTDGAGSARVVRSTRRRGDAADLPVRLMENRSAADVRHSAGRSGSSPSGDHADPASRRRVDDDGDLCERQLDGDQRSAAQAGGVPAMSTVAVLRCGTRQSEDPPRMEQGLSPAETLVGVTGFEPAASSSRTGDHSSLPCC